MIITLVGMPTSGKSLIGKKLATSLEASFLDLDKEIERKCKCSIKTIFEKKGEIFFRRIESKILRRVLASKKKDLILSLGGGAFIAEENKKICLEHTLVFWLNVDINILYSRLKIAKIQRPILKDINSKKDLSILLEERKKHYKKAHKIINVNKEKKLKDIVKEIIENAR